jgi:hypothetical protein
VTGAWFDLAVSRRHTVDVTIIVRTWVEPEDERPRARLTRVPDGQQQAAIGELAIESAFSSMLREAVAAARE